MNLQRLRRSASRLSQKLVSRFGWDVMSLTRINRRGDLRHIGSTYGGWVVPLRLLSASSVCYCVGCGEDVSFDLGLIELLGCEIYAFDPTPRAVIHVQQVAGANPRYHFFEIGLWHSDDTLKFFAPRDPEHVSHSLVDLQKTDESIVVKVRRLANIMKELGHQRLTLLKLDIEGAEYNVLRSIIDDNIEIDVLCVEYHGYYNALDDNYRTRIRESVNSLLARGYSLVHAKGDGNYTFVNRSAG